MPEAPATIGVLLRATRDRLAVAGCPEAAADARILLAEALGLAVGQLFLKEGEPAGDLPSLEPWVQRRMRGEPVYRILGRRAFYDHEFRLSPETLEPRPDTETLVDLAIEVLNGSFGRNAPFGFIDIGTGTGAIAVSLLSAFPSAYGVASDISEGAARMARRNAADAGVDARLGCFVGSYLDAVAGRFAAIVSNPPYIPSDEIAGLARDVRHFDPLAALDGGPDGLDAYRQIAMAAPRTLLPGGALLLEIGAGQGNEVRSIAAAAGLRFRSSATDLGGHERALWFSTDVKATSA